MSEQDTQPGQAPSGAGQHPYFVDGVPYDSASSTLTGAQIKARIPNFNPSYQLVREARGDEPDKVVRDTDTESLGPPPPMFYTVPPANFGG
jgi:hypothetical protein